MPRDVPDDVLELAPLRGLRYADSDARAFLDSPSVDIALALAPPYDVLDARSYSTLVEADPHNAARLTAPPAATSVTTPTDGTAVDRYRDAARAWRLWRDTGVLVRDREPSLYVYEQTCPTGGRQRGLIGALRLPTVGSTAVRPHEEVAERLVADRARLMRETQANLEPIFLLYRGGAGAQRGAASRATEATANAPTPPLVDTVTDDGCSHRLWRIADPRTQADIAADLATRTALIADGHHRYSAYQRLRAQRGTPSPWEHGLALLVDSDAWPPHLGAIHRVIRGLDVDTAVEAASAVAVVEPLADRGGGTTAARTVASAAASGPALLLAGPDSRYLLRGPGADVTPSTARRHSAAVASVAMLDEVLLPLWGVGDDRVELVHDDPAAAFAGVGGNRGAGTAVIVPPLRVEDVYAITARGDLAPRKSTSFGPKPRTGLVLRSLD